jgi:hypothetical protein
VLTFTFIDSLTQGIFEAACREILLAKYIGSTHNTFEFKEVKNTIPIKL